MEETDTGQAEAESHRCKACRKPIKPNAKLCPYCHSRQTDTPWHKISVLLQWSAGAVTMVSLIVALNTLTNFYAGWLEKKNTVEELTYAAHWLEQSDNFYYAWNLVDQALDLDPSNARIRQYQIDLAMHWLRSGSTRSNRKASYTELADTVTPVLYRALTSLNDQHAADVFAHIGFAKFLKSRETAVLTDINAVFAKALQYDNNNLYANVFRGFWLLFDHQDTHYQEAINHFENALNNHKNNDAQAWINDWYLAGLNLVRDTKSEPTNHDVAKRLFALANQMRKSNHPIDNSRIRDNMLRLFGSFRELDTNIEQLLTILPPEEFLQTLHWLAGNSDFEINGAQKTDSQNTVSHKTILPQAMAAQYVMARLNERLGRNDAALPIYKELLNNNPHKRLKQHIVDAYIRITQHPPQEVLARTYMNDPVPSTGDLWQFHADSLLKFDFVWQPHNFTAALDFFEPTPDNPALRGRVTEALQIFAQARDRIKEWIDVRERQLLSGNQ
ncbi:MAG: hypothetical protein PVF82_21340, partial [Gammaproteobacteria bacterium]